MLAEFEKFQIVNVINGNLVDHNMKGIEYVSCFETRHLISFFLMSIVLIQPGTGSHTTDCGPPGGGGQSLSRPANT